MVAVARRRAALPVTIAAFDTGLGAGTRSTSTSTNDTTNDTTGVDTLITMARRSLDTDR